MNVKKIDLSRMKIEKIHSMDNGTPCGIASGTFNGIRHNMQISQSYCDCGVVFETVNCDCGFCVYARYGSGCCQYNHNDPNDPSELNLDEGHKGLYEFAMKYTK